MGRSLPVYAVDWADKSDPEIWYCGPGGRTLIEVKQEIITYFTEQYVTAFEVIRKTRAVRVKDIKKEDEEL